MLGNFVRNSIILKNISIYDTLLIKRNAGHSKWQNIRHIKGAKDAERSRNFAKLGIALKVAVTEGGSADPKKNIKLEQVIEQCKRINMPVATVQSILKHCQTDKTQMKSQVLEILGPGSCFILCEIYTDKPHIFKQNLTSLLKKFRSKYTDGIKHAFEEKGIILADLPEHISKDEAKVEETITDHAILAGAEDVQLIETNTVEFYCGVTNLNSVAQEIEKLGYKVSSASVEYIPIKSHQLEDSDIELCEKFYSKLEAMPEIVKLSDNIA